MTEPTEIAWPWTGNGAAHVFVPEQLDEHVVITGDDGHHLARVLRLEPGEAVTGADAAGRWRCFRVESVSAGTVSLRAEGDVRLEPTLTPGLAVAFAITKGEKPEATVARLTELGVDRMVAVPTRRSVVRWSGDQRGPKLERLRRVAREAAMQCRRARLPTIEIADSIEALAGHPGLMIAAREGGSIVDLPDPGPGGWLVLIGPEGGLDLMEHRFLARVPRLVVGPHVLRSETAAVAVAAVLTVRRRSTTRHAGWATLEDS